MSLCHHTSVLTFKSKDQHDLMVPEWTSLTFHMCRVNPNVGFLPRTIIGPNGAWMVAPINSSLEPPDSCHRDDARYLVFQRGSRSWANGLSSKDDVEHPHHLRK